MHLPNSFKTFDERIEAALASAGGPGAALAVVHRGRLVHCAAWGLRDRDRELPMTPGTAYPIASTTKAMTCALLQLLVDERVLEWDEPVIRMVPTLQFADPILTAQTTLRDLVTMRTGLPRHDWLWLANPMTRAQLAKRIGGLPLSAPFRSRFQYNNLTVTLAGHVAEMATGASWEALVQERLLGPLGMTDTRFGKPSGRPVTRSYFEARGGAQHLSPELELTVTGPSGGSIYSTVEDMAKWLAFNLGHASGAPLGPEAIAFLQSPQILVGSDPSAPSDYASYAFGWFVDWIDGTRRISHGGYAHHVNSEISLFPQAQLGIISFCNFGPARLARALNADAWRLLNGIDGSSEIVARMSAYRERVAAETDRRTAPQIGRRGPPSHEPGAYAGAYRHPAYGNVAILVEEGRLRLRRGELDLALQHQNFDYWVAQDGDFVAIDGPHPFDPCAPIGFETAADGAVASVSIRLEPAVPPIRFERANDAD